MKSIVLALVAILVPVGAAGAAEGRRAESRRTESRPNFVVVLIDDMGYGDLGCYGGAAKTPEMDRLAREGIRLTQFYVAAPICSPSRCGLLTGQRPQRHRITSFLETREANERRGMAQWLDPAAPSLARVLHEAGYRTGHFGKWHLGGQRDVGEAPLISEYGFDASLTNFEGLGDRVLPIMGGFDGRPRQKLPLGLGSEKLGRGEIAWAPRHEVTGRFVERAVAFIDESRRAKAPFYINLWPDDVHSPFSPPPGADADATKATRYRAVLENLDRSLGVLFDRLRQDPELEANTLVLLLSDNGPEPGAGQTGGLRGHKGLLYEGGIREPLIAWGGLISPEKRGATDEASVLSTLDFFPSLTHLAGLPGSKTCDGEDHSEALTGRGVAKRRKPLLWKRPPDRPKDGDTVAPDLAIRAGDWKLLMQGDGSGCQLYDLKTDPSESKNLAADSGDVVWELRTMLDDWSKELSPSTE